MDNVTYPYGDFTLGHCLWCGSALPEPVRRNRKWCSDSCGSKASAFRTRGIVGERYPADKKPVPTNCRGCGVELDQSGCRNPRRWCSSACRVAFYHRNSESYRESSAASYQRSLQRLEASKPPRPRCKNCGAEMSRRKANVFCSKPECRSKSRKEYAMRQPQCVVDGCSRPASAYGMCGSHYSARWRLENPGKASAARTRYRARKRSAFVEDVDPLAVFERDKWTCGICGERIPKRAKWPDMRSASVDHIVPLACGGKHEMRNVQASHLGCNSVKQNRGSGEQLALI